MYVFSLRCYKRKEGEGMGGGGECREREKGERKTQMQTQGQETTDAGVMQLESRSKGTLTR